MKERNLNDPKKHTVAQNNSTHNIEMYDLRCIGRTLLSKSNTSVVMNSLDSKIRIFR